MMRTSLKICTTIVLTYLVHSFTPIAGAGAAHQAPISVGGTISGLGPNEFAKVELRFRSGRYAIEEVQLKRNGKFSSTKPLKRGLSYTIRALTKPSFRTCKILDPGGSLMTSINNISIDCSTAQSPQTPHVIPKLSIVNVWDFGATPDDLTDDTDSIQAAIHFASQIYQTHQLRVTVHFPAGTYQVSPQPRPDGKSEFSVFTVSSGLTLAGESGSQKISAFPEQITAPQSKLVVSAPLGNYNSVFASDQHRGKPDANPSRTLVESVEFKSLWINQNPSRVKNAHISNDKSQGGAYQFAILLKSFSNVLVERMRFEPATGVNTIALGGPKSQGAIINSNYFRFINGNPDHKDYDNSSVYIDSKNQEVKNNHFVSRPEEGARAAIEAHSGPALVTENRSWGFMTGVNITSTSPGNNINDEDENPNAFENNITVSHNEFFGTITGIKLWSFAKRTDRLIQRRLYGVTIVENRVKMANRSELKRRMDAGRPIPGIVCAICFTREAMVKDFKDGNFENIAITQNEITYPNESAVYSMPNNTNLNPDQKNKPPIRLELSAAFLMRPKSQLKNIRIERNSIKNAPSYLMILGGGEIPTPSSIGSSDIRFLSNTVINAARDGTLSQNFAFSTLIDVKARYKGVRIENNTIKDTNATPYVGVIYREDSAPSDSTNGESQKTSPGLDFTDTAKGNNKIELATDKYEVVQSPARVRIQKKTLAR